jgi:hypothetical protein
MKWASLEPISQGGEAWEGYFHAACSLQAANVLVARMGGGGGGAGRRVVSTIIGSA